jgi:crotonobetainyl-CoA:carnitine CoA-transferase CaiB-like acyl-CoA transferase
VLEAPELAAFDDPKRLFEERDVVHRLLSEHTRRWQRADLLEALLKAGIWCGEIKTHLEVEQDPQVRHMKMITSYEHPAIGRVKAVAPAVELSKTPASIRTPSPGVGQHTAEVLRSLGIAEGVIASLIANKVIEQEAPAHRAAAAG